MSCIQQQSPTAIRMGLPVLRINTDVPCLRKASFEEISSAPVTKKELGTQDATQQQYGHGVAFRSNNWRRTMTVPPCSAGTNSSTEDPSPERVFSNEDALANTSGSSDHRISPVNQGDIIAMTQEGRVTGCSPIISETSSASTPSGSTETPLGAREPALARIISHGYSTFRSLGGKAPGSMDKMDIFEILPAALNAEGRAVCPHHNDHGICDCEAFPLVKISFPPPMDQHNRVCYPIQEVDEPRTEPRAVPDVGPAPKVSSQQAADEARGDEEKRRFEAERFKGLLGKLRRSAEDKCSRLIKEWKDPVTGRSEPLPSWDEETRLAWARRLKEYTDLVQKKYAPGNDRPATVDEQPADLGSTVPPAVAKRTVEKAASPVEQSDIRLTADHSRQKLQTTWNPKAKEFLPPKFTTPRPVVFGPEDQGAKAREMLARFVAEAKARETGHGNGSKGQARNEAVNEAKNEAKGEAAKNEAKNEVENEVKIEAKVEAKIAAMDEIKAEIKNETKHEATKEVTTEAKNEPALTAAVPSNPAPSNLPFLSRMTNFHPDMLASAYGLAPSLAHMLASVSPMGTATPTSLDASFAGLGTPGLMSPKFDFSPPLNGLGAINHTLVSTLAGVPSMGTASLGGRAGASFGPYRPFYHGLAGTMGSLPPAPSRLPPGPVPKPRMPDAQGQQQYEQWIEWRKANEPGYAIECKARQARRAQRARPTTGSSVTKSEVRGGTSVAGSSETRSGDPKLE